MNELSELDEIIVRNANLEDAFVKEALERIKSYETFKKQFNQDDLGPKRITLYTDDIPCYKYLANVEG